jgi:hypothetical protein
MDATTSSHHCSLTAHRIAVALVLLTAIVLPLLRHYHVISPIPWLSYVQMSCGALYMASFLWLAKAHTDPYHARLARRVGVWGLVVYGLLLIMMLAFPSR